MNFAMEKCVLVPFPFVAYTYILKKDGTPVWRSFIFADASFANTGLLFSVEFTRCATSYTAAGILLAFVGIF